MRARFVLLFLVLLIPSARYAWKNRDMPQFERTHDDGLLFVSAESLATGQGFRILSLPEQPAQTKYPVLYPLFLSIAWRIHPNFPQNLIVATALDWMLIVLCLALAWLFYRQEKLPAWPLTALLAFSPYLILFGTRTFTEVFFTCWLLATFLLASRESLAMAVLAGMCAGCAYLSRTAGLPLVVAVPAWYLWKRDRSRAIAFAAAMLPFILLWMLWSRSHLLPTSDPTLIYYTDYFKYERLNVGWDNIHLVIWHNIDELLYRAGVLALPGLIDLKIMRILTQVVAVGMISGIVRLARRGVAVPYALFAGLSSAILLVWHGIDERLLLPLFPLLIAGLFTELEHLFAMIGQARRHKDRSQRIMAGVFATAVLLLCAIALAAQLYLTFFAIDNVAATDRQKLVARRQAYAWISQHVPTGAAILSNDDPLLYLYTGHRGNGVFPLMRDLYYGDSRAAVLNAYRDVVPSSTSRGLSYFFASEGDLARWGVDPELSSVVHSMLQSNPGLTPVYANDAGTLYKISP
jgi:hypothetical protein